MKCQYCGSDAALPFKCPFCGGYFCAEHRLPELHACQGISKEPLKRIIPSEKSGRVKVGRGKFYSRLIFLRNLVISGEIAQVALGTLMVMFVGSSIALFNPSLMDPILLLGLAVIFASAFIPHELGHKFVAMHYGLWAEFRLTFLGALITLISVVSPIKIISPGAVIISGEVNREIIGKTSLSGPLVNLTLSAIFLILTPTTYNSVFETIVIWGLGINAWTALFNLIPFSILDGAKIFWWNKYIWLLSFLASLILAAASLMIL
ncbi:MAG: AN1-type zinc finger domain-containing protein [Candidatus Bathyarchaeia archaeon]